MNKPLEGLTNLAQTEVVDTASDSLSRLKGNLKEVGEELGYIRSEIETDIVLRARKVSRDHALDRSYVYFVCRIICAKHHFLTYS